jgi:hypothetical protein
MIKFVRVTALLLLLACSAQAGDMQNGTPQPPPPSTPSTSTTNEPEEPAAEGDVPNELADTLTEAAVSVLNNVLALL